MPPGSPPSRSITTARASNRPTVLIVAAGGPPASARRRGGASEVVALPDLAGVAQLHVGLPLRRPAGGPSSRRGTQPDQAQQRTRHLQRKGLA